VGKILDSLKSVKAFVLRDIDLKRIITNGQVCALSLHLIKTSLVPM